jgi:DNA-binding FadR family transcriptional regulator
LIGLKIGLKMVRATTPETLKKLRRYLSKNTYAQGDRLPSERALSSQLGCSRETLRACLKILITEGVIWQHVGQGTFYGRPHTPSPIRETILFEASSPFEILQARLLLEPQVAAEAARKATPEDIKFLKQCVENCRKAPDQYECEEADSKFHNAIAHISQNSILTAFFKFLAEARKRAKWKRQWQYAYQSKEKRGYQAEQHIQHTKIVEAITAADPEAAYEAMKQHLETVSTEMIR